uniref:Uncharacterized protein n=1 Tax=Vitis vinifera TaxID=29760 RepID=F6HXL7_VITVI
MDKSIGFLLVCLQNMSLRTTMHINFLLSYFPLSFGWFISQ